MQWIKTTGKNDSALPDAHAVPNHEAGVNFLQKKLKGFKVSINGKAFEEGDKRVKAEHPIKTLGGAGKGWSVIRCLD
jgi:hypothetical protein